MIHLPHNIDVFISFDDNIELKSGSDGKRKAKLWGNINVELVFLFLRFETLDSIEIVGVCLVEMRI